jgi:hypothetical protein
MPAAYDCFSDREKCHNGLAAEALTANRFGNMDGTIAPQTSLISLCDAGEKMMGVIPADAASGAPAALVYSGEGYLICDGTAADLVIGSLLKSDANGAGVVTTTPGEWYGAIAREPYTTNAEGLVRVWIVQPNTVPA